MANSKFLKLAVSGAAVAAIAIGIGVGVGVHNKKTKDAAAAASAANYEDCRRLLVVPGIDIEDNVADAPSIRRKLLARRLGEITTTVMESYEKTDDWEGDTWQEPAQSAYPAASITKSSSSKGLKGTKGPTTAFGFTNTKGTSGKGPKGSKGSTALNGITGKGPKGPKGSNATLGITSPKGSKSTNGIMVSGPKGPKGSKSKGLPVRVYWISVLCSIILLRRSCFSDSSFEYKSLFTSHIVLLLCTKARQM